jgi:tRNA wybutosine-synthesizing protein 2
MGCIDDTYTFLPTAISCLKNKSGFLHYHDVCPDELLPDQMLTRLEEGIKEYSPVIELVNFRRIKSYAPGVSHVVLDLKIGGT